MNSVIKKNKVTLKNIKVHNMCSQKRTTEKCKNIKESLNSIEHRKVDDLQRKKTLDVIWENMHGERVVASK